MRWSRPPQRCGHKIVSDAAVVAIVENRSPLQPTTVLLVAALKPRLAGTASTTDKGLPDNEYVEIVGGEPAPVMVAPTAK